MNKLFHFFLLLTCMLTLASPAQAGDPDAMSEIVKSRINRAAMVPDVLQNPGFEVRDDAKKLPGWSGVVHADDRYLVELDDAQMFSGKRSLLIENRGKPSWGGAIQTIRAERLADQEIELSARVKSQEVTAPGFHMSIKIMQMGRELRTVKTDGLMIGDADWKIMSLRTRLPIETTHLEVDLILEGDGRVWVDDVRIDTLVEKSQHPSGM